MSHLKTVAKTLLADLEKQLRSAHIFSNVLHEGEKADEQHSHKLLQLRLHKDFNRHGQHLRDLATMPTLRQEIESEMGFTTQQKTILQQVLALETSRVTLEKRFVTSIVQRHSQPESHEVIPSTPLKP